MRVPDRFGQPRGYHASSAAGPLSKGGDINNNNNTVAGYTEWNGLDIIVVHLHGTNTRSTTNGLTHPHSSTTNPATPTKPFITYPSLPSAHDAVARLAEARVVAQTVHDLTLASRPVLVMVSSPTRL